MGSQNISHLFTQLFSSDSILYRSLGENFSLCDNGNITFHWADFFETCNLLKLKIQTDPKLNRDFINCENALKQLNEIPVWIKTNKKIIQTTMFNVYDHFILNQTQLPGSLASSNPIEISFISSTGPYKEMDIISCLNEATYKDFVLLYLLKEKLPSRDFRIRLNSKILFEYGPHFSHAELISLDQLTSIGMLFSMSAEKFSKNMSRFDKVRILINYHVLSEGAGKNLDELKNILSDYSFNFLYSSHKGDALLTSIKDFKVQSPFDFGKSGKAYLFISYDKFDKSNSEAIGLIQKFVAHTRDLVEDHFIYKNSLMRSA